MLPCGDGGERLCGTIGQLGEIQRDALEPHLAGFEPGEHEEVIDHAAQQLHIGASGSPWPSAPQIWLRRTGSTPHRDDALACERGIAAAPAGQILGQDEGSHHDEHARSAQQQDACERASGWNDRYDHLAESAALTDVAQGLRHLLESERSVDVDPHLTGAT